MKVKPTKIADPKSDFVEDRLRYKIKILRKTIKDFLEGYDKAEPSVRGVYTLAFAHGYNYTGYQYTKELEALRKVVKK